MPPLLRPVTLLSVALFCLLFLLLCSGKVLDHAHVWIYSAVIVLFDKDGMAGFKQEWVFDEMFSHMIIHDYDKNQNGRFEPEEVEEIYKRAFSNLKNFRLFYKGHVFEPFHAPRRRLERLYRYHEYPV